MAEQLVAIGFAGAGTAEGMLDNVRDMERRGLLELDDAVVISRPPQAERLVVRTVPGASESTAPLGPGLTEPTITQTDARRGRHAAAGAGIGMLAGWLLGGPIGGAAVGAIVGALRDRGIDDNFVRNLSEQLQPDSSAIVLLVKRGEAAQVIEELRPHRGTVIHTTLAPEVERALRDALAHEE